MKAHEITFVASVIKQLGKVPAQSLTQEYVATLFADRLETRYPTNFDRTVFLHATGVSARMIEDAETKILV